MKFDNKSSVKNNEIKKLKAELADNKIKMEVDAEKIATLREDLNDFNDGVRITVRSMINITNNFNDIFPDYSTETVKNNS